MFTNSLYVYLLYIIIRLFTRTTLLDKQFAFAATFPGYTTLPTIPTTQNQQTLVFSQLGVISSQSNILPSHSAAGNGGVQQQKQQEMHKVTWGRFVTCYISLKIDENCRSSAGKKWCKKWPATLEPSLGRNSNRDNACKCPRPWSDPNQQPR